MQTSSGTRAFSLGLSSPPRGEGQRGVLRAAWDAASLPPFLPSRRWALGALRTPGGLGPLRWALPCPVSTVWWGLVVGTLVPQFTPLARGTVVGLPRRGGREGGLGTAVSVALLHVIIATAVSTLSALFVLGGGGNDTRGCSWGAAGWGLTPGGSGVSEGSVGSRQETPWSVAPPGTPEAPCVSRGRGAGGHADTRGFGDSAAGIESPLPARRDVWRFP